jgi:hypothetical protein
MNYSYGPCPPIPKPVREGEEHEVNIEAISVLRRTRLKRLLQMIRLLLLLSTRLQ